MRVPLMPLALSLAVGGLLYAAYQGNKRIVDAAASRPAATVLAAAAVRPRAATTPPGASAAIVTAADESEDKDEDEDDLDERCTAIAELADAAVDAIDAGAPYDEFIRRPVVAFVNDPTLRVELEKLARSLYDTPPDSPASARRIALRAARCR